jgi:CDP-diacylglycerol--glycerol-3-phosphate 3-phosphatidyltransferase
MSGAEDRRALGAVRRRARAPVRRGEAPRSATWLIAGTSLRIVVAPIVMALVLAGTRAADVAAAVLFAVAAATDFLDGYLARRWGAATTLGAFLDTTADKLLVACVLVALVAVGRASPWPAVIIIAREITILGLRGSVAAEGNVFPPSPGGKAKAALQFVAVLLAILRPGAPVGGAYVDEWLMLAAAAVTVVTGAEYLARFSATLRRGT